MNHKGFTFIEVLIGILLIGIVAITTLPIISLSFNNFSNLKYRMEMSYIGEMVIEKIKSFDVNSPEGEYIFDVNINDMILKFRENNSVKITIKNQDNNGKPYCEIFKIDKGENLWEVIVKVYSNNQGGRVKSESFKTYIPRK